MVIVCIISALLLALLLFYFSWSISLGVYLRCICSRPEAVDSIALTYDDGVDPRLTPALLDLLARHSAKATFCMVGDRAESYPEIVRRVAKDGHTIVNHSMYHKASFPMQSSQRIFAEIERCSATLEQISGKKIKYFRPPFGVTNPMIATAVRKTDMQGLGWSIRSYDTVEEDAQKVAKRVLSQIKGGDIVLLHDNRDNVLKITEEILTNINHRGLKAISIEQLLDGRPKDAL